MMRLAAVGRLLQVRQCGLAIGLWELTTLIPLKTLQGVKVHPVSVRRTWECRIPKSRPIGSLKQPRLPRLLAAVFGLVEGCALGRLAAPLPCFDAALSRPPPSCRCPFAAAVARPGACCSTVLCHGV